MATVTREDIVKMNELYLTIGTYAGVARECGFSPSTVKRYIQPGYISTEKREYIRVSDELPEFDHVSLRGADWKKLCELTDAEKDEIRALWKEMDV